MMILGKLTLAYGVATNQRQGAFRSAVHAGGVEYISTGVVVNRV